VLGVDLSSEAIAAALTAQSDRAIHNAEFRCVAVEELALEERFDTVVCLALLHHLPPQTLPGFLAAISDHLVSGGLFYSQDPNVFGILRSVGRRILGRRYDAYHSEDERELDPREVVTTLRGAGLDDVLVSYVDLTLIPMLFLMTRGPDSVFHVCAAFDRLWCASPLARWASGFSLIARKAPAARDT